MKLLANENVPGEAVHALRQAGMDVVWVSEVAVGAKDLDVVQQAQSGGWILLTFDKDFGELVFRQGAQVPGVILVRARLQSPQSVAKLLVAALTQNLPWEGNFAVVREGQIRMVPLPKKVS